MPGGGPRTGRWRGCSSLSGRTYIGRKCTKRSVSGPRPYQRLRCCCVYVPCHGERGGWGEVDATRGEEVGDAMDIRCLCPPVVKCELTSGQCRCRCRQNRRKTAVDFKAALAACLGKRLDRMRQVRSAGTCDLIQGGARNGAGVEQAWQGSSAGALAWTNGATRRDCGLAFGRHVWAARMNL